MDNQLRIMAWKADAEIQLLETQLKALKEGPSLPLKTAEVEARISGKKSALGSMCRANDFTYGKYGPQEGEVKPVKNKEQPSTVDGNTESKPVITGNRVGTVKNSTSPAQKDEPALPSSETILSPNHKTVQPAHVYAGFDDTFMDDLYPSSSAYAHNHAFYANAADQPGVDPNNPFNDPKYDLHIPAPTEEAPVPSLQLGNDGLVAAAAADVEIKEDITDIFAGIEDKYNNL